MKMTVEQTAPMQTLAPKCKTSEVVSCCASTQQRRIIAICGRALVQTSPVSPLANAPIVENISTHRGLILCLYILDRISGEHRPLVPGLFERATELHFKTLGDE